MTTKRLLNSLFQYKASVDEELFNALAAFPEGEGRERFNAALRVLNHAHIVDRIFAANLQGQNHSYKQSWVNEAPAVAGLARAVRDTDQWYLNFISRVSPDELEESVDFTFADGGHGRMTREEMLAHVVTHSGYHRGEAGRLLPEIEGTAMRDVFAGFLHRSEPQRRQ